jgi:hypothetical protein
VPVEGDGGSAVESIASGARSAVEALAAVGGRIAESAPQALRWSLEHAAEAGLAVGAMVGVTIVVRWLLTRRALIKRVRYAMLPTETFDPTSEEIVRFASQLSRARRSVGPLGSRCSDAVRLQLVSAPGGRMLQLIEGPARAESVLRIGGFAEVELRPLEDLDVDALGALQLTPTPADEEADQLAETPGGGQGADGPGGVDHDEQLPVGTVDEAEGWVA